MAVAVSTINVNGIRAAVRKGMHAWIERTSPDVIALQEVRAPTTELTGGLGAPWNLAHAESRTAGRAGVAVASRIAPRSSSVDLPVARFAGSGRWVEAEFATSDGRGLTVVSAYVHTGDADSPERMEEKLAFMAHMDARMSDLLATGRHVLINGDLNVAHREVDIKNWKGNVGAAGFLPEERAVFDRWFASGHWVDLARLLCGPGPGPYTWWTYRGRAYDNDVGWRIDYQIASADLAALAKEGGVDRSETYADRWSDHSPFTVVFDLDLSS